MGRAYLGDREGLQTLARGLVLGGLIYAPLCLWEMRASPHLHTSAYGFTQAGNFAATIRYGGYRPLIFMSTGLEVGMFMAAAALVATWLWAQGGLGKTLGLPPGPVALFLVAVAVLCKSTGAILEMLLGLAVLWASRRLRSACLAVVLALIAPGYCALRGSGLWDGQQAVAVARSLFGKDRSNSLEFRIINEDMLIR